MTRIYRLGGILATSTWRADALCVSYDRFPLTRVDHFHSHHPFLPPHLVPRDQLLPSHTLRHPQPPTCIHHTNIGLQYQVRVVPQEKTPPCHCVHIVASVTAHALASLNAAGQGGAAIHLENGSEAGVLGSDEHKAAGDGWQEFKKGIVHIPDLFFHTLLYAPLPFLATTASVTWRLKANVHRPGIFTPKLSASCEIILVASPNEDREDTAGVAIERTWGDQIRYTLSVSGQMFPIGGSIPITLSFLPMAKVKIYKISVHLEEQVMFLTFESMFRRRIDAGQRFELLSLESKDKNSPLLPHSQTVTDSPLYALLGSSDLLPSELAANLMGPGPWTLQMDLKVPNGFRTLHCSNKNRRAPIQISHILKIVTRVERGDDKQMDPKTGKRKRFDVILRVPVHILSSLASAQHVALPCYTETPDAPSPPPAPRVSWGRGRRHSLPYSRHTFAPESLITAGPLEPFIFPEGPSHEVDAQYERSAIFERLITGQQSEAGVVPPAYSPTL
ncbi:hypothetical protein EDB89DRAFT_2067121 [Lactarius sanguifluus]|nr:hypothetical protein EDB89DRAFT_2067121 [Lactarius sanguifluus]